MSKPFILHDPDYLRQVWKKTSRESYFKDCGCVAADLCSFCCSTLHHIKVAGKLDDPRAPSAMGIVSNIVATRAALDSVLIYSPRLVHRVVRTTLFFLDDVRTPRTLFLVALLTLHNVFVIPEFTSAIVPLAFHFRLKTLPWVISSLRRLKAEEIGEKLLIDIARRLSVM